MRIFIYECRKLFDTRSSMVVMAVCVVVAVALGCIGLWARTREGSIDLSQMAAAAVLPFAIVTPILGVLTAASDWSTGCIQQTLFIEPRRERLFLAKASAAFAASMAVSVIAIVLAIVTGLAVGLFTNQPTVAGRVGVMLWGVLAIVLPGSLLGFGLGALVLSTPLAIAFVLVTELVLDVALSTIPGGAGIYLMSATFPNWLASGAEPLAAASSFVIWILAPIGLGLVRYLRHEAAS